MSAHYNLPTIIRLSNSPVSRKNLGLHHGSAKALDVSGHFAVALNGLTSALKFATDLFLRVQIVGLRNFTLHPSGNHGEPRNYVIKRGLEDNSPFSLV